MRYLGNYHSHSNFCDGSADIEDYIWEAVEQGFHAYGISSHAPLPYSIKWCMDSKELKSYLRYISHLKEKWKNQIEIYASLEIDYIPEVAGPKSEYIQSLGLDYTIGSVHFVDFIDEVTPWEIDGSPNHFKRGLDLIFKGDIQAAVEKYFELTRQMVIAQTPDIVGHLDKIKMQNKVFPYFNEDESWYRNAVLKTLEVIAEKKCMIEINTRGWYKGKTEALYPSDWIIREIAQRKIPVVINSDAHQPHEISKGFEVAEEVLLQNGIQETYNLYNGVWRATSVGNKEYLDKTA